MRCAVAAKSAELISRVSKREVKRAYMPIRQDLQKTALFIDFKFSHARTFRTKQCVTLLRDV
jgi:hypothetical protein